MRTHYVGFFIVLLCIVFIKLGMMYTENGNPTAMAIYSMSGNNTAPQISALPPVAVLASEGFDPLDLSLYVTDAEDSSQDLVWTVASNPYLDVKIDGSIVTLNRSFPTWSGSTNLSFRVTDPGGLFDDADMLIEVTDDNNPPLLQPFTFYFIREGQVLQLHPVVVDPDGDDITLTYESPLNETGGWYIPFDYVGMNTTITLDVTADDGRGGITTESVLVLIEDVEGGLVDCGTDESCFERRFEYCLPGLYRDYSGYDDVLMQYTHEIRGYSGGDCIVNSTQLNARLFKFNKQSMLCGFDTRYDFDNQWYELMYENYGAYDCTGPLFSMFDSWSTDIITGYNWTANSTSLSFSVNTSNPALFRIEIYDDMNGDKLFENMSYGWVHLDMRESQTGYQNYTEVLPYLVQQHGTVAKNLPTGRSLEIYISAFDGNGTDSVGNYVILKNTLDKSAPGITKVDVSDMNASSISLMITTNESCKPKVYYGKSKSAMSFTRSITQPNTSFNVSIDYLTSMQNYYFNVTCKDDAGNTGYYPLFNVTTKKGIGAPKFDDFNGNTTDFNNVQNISCVKNATVEVKGFGKINFNHSCVDFADLDLDKNIKIMNNSIELDSKDLPSLNISAVLTLYNVSFKYPYILKDGKQCLNCTLLKHNASQLSFAVLSFSTYTVKELVTLDTSSTLADANYTHTNHLFFAKVYHLGKELNASNASCNFTYSYASKTLKLNMPYSNRFSVIVNATDNGTVKYNYSCNALGKHLTVTGNFTLKHNFICGDGYCSPSEDCTSCARDCVCESCKPDWQCTKWSVCEDGQQTRTCTDNNACGTLDDKPEEAQACMMLDLCSNKQIDDGEEGIDCGGSCAPCGTCFDGVRNQDETGVDCGGICGACATCTDGVRNQGEAGVDCGGPCPDACAPKPAVEEEPSADNSMMMTIIIIVVFILVIGGIGGVAYIKPELFSGLTSMGSSTSASDEGLVNYIQQALLKGYSPQKVEQMLMDSDWEPKQIEGSMNKAVKQVKDIYINQLIPIISKYDVTNPRVVVSIMKMQQYDKALLREALQQVLAKYPDAKKRAVMPYLEM